MRMADYPKNWKEISLQIRAERAGGKCERCGAFDGNPHPVTGSIVVLTVAHYPDPNPMNCNPANLQALCQRCHNRLDAPMRARNRRRNRELKQTAAGQLSMEVSA